MKPPQLEVIFDQPEAFALKFEQSQDGARIAREQTQLEADRNESDRRQLDLNQAPKTSGKMKKPIDPPRPDSTPADETQTPETSMARLFGETIYTYTRAQALLDGVQVEVPRATTREAGVSYPVFLTRAVWDNYVQVPEGVTGQDEAGRLWDLIWMLRFAIAKSPGGERLPVELYVRNDNRAAKLIQLVAICGAMDIDDPNPAITVMLPDED